MSTLDGWRQEIRGLIPRGFLRRDQGAGLFVSDYPRNGEEIKISRSLREAGYVAEIRNRLAYLDGSLEKYCALADALTDATVRPQEEFFWLYKLAYHLQKTGAEPTMENLPLLRLTMKLLDAKDLDSLQCLLPPAAAEAQRKHIPLPRAAGQMILRTLNEREESFMLITYHGHSEFYLEAANGFALLTDPYDDHVGYPMGTYRADAVTVTHGHGDHNYTAKATGTPAIIDSAGEWYPAPEVKVTAIPSVHDDMGGAKRGKNLIMKIEMEGLTLVHLGDQGAPLTADQLKALGKVDILMIPIGGFYTIDFRTAYEMVQAVKPRVTIPMHFKTKVNADWPITDEKEFLRLMGEPNAQPMPLLRVTKQDLSEQPALALLQCRG